MAYEKTVPEWQEEGAAIPASKLSTGWEQAERPPANWFNRFFFSVTQAIMELQEKSAEKEYVDEQVTSIGTAKLDTSSVTHTTGTSETLVMSQKGVTDAISSSSSSALSTLDSKVDKSAIMDYEGASSTLVMSQKAITDALSLKVDKTSIATETGSSNTLVMSQKAITDLHNQQAEALENGLSGKIDKAVITHVLGSDSEAVMSQKGVNDALATKVNTSSVKQTVNASTTDVPSCAAVASYVANNTPKVSYGTVLPTSGAEGEIFILYS